MTVIAKTNKHQYEGVHSQLKKYNTNLAIDYVEELLREPDQEIL